MRIINRFLVSSLLLVCLVAPATASIGESAKQLIMETTDLVFSALRRDREIFREDPERVYTLVNDIILPHFDFPRMSRWVLGKHWKRATEEQRERFIEEFKTLLVNTYATALVQFTDQDVGYLPMRTKAGSKTVMVRTEVKQAGGQPIPINYRMYRKDGVWKVVDVTIDGVSLVKNYRSTYSTEIRRSGLESLISQLAERNRAVKK